MNEYYGIASTPTEDFLAHYGVKGMKWGVRKAISRGNDRALRRHYAQASRKLQTLMARSDKDLVSQAKKQNIKSTVASSLGSGIGSAGLTYAINSHLPAKQRALLSAGIGGTMLAANAIAGGVNHAILSRYGSKAGHAKQNAKRREFEREMRSAFKGTKYGKQIDRTKANIQKNIANAKRTLDPSGSYSQTNTSKPKLSRRDRRAVNEGLTNWANAFEKHYQTGLSRGMTHEQAERYSNNYIAKYGFKSARSNNRKRR